MRTKPEVLKRLEAYKGIELIYHDWGYIVWQVSTGENVEEILIEVAQKGQGAGHQLWREACARLKEQGLPYHSVFAYHLKSRPLPDHFYTSLGFSRHEIPDLYKGDIAVLRVCPFTKLCEKLHV